MEIGKNKLVAVTEATMKRLGFTVEICEKILDTYFKTHPYKGSKQTPDIYYHFTGHYATIQSLVDFKYASERFSMDVTYEQDLMTAVNDLLAFYGLRENKDFMDRYADEHGEVLGMLSKKQIQYDHNFADKFIKNLMKTGLAKSFKVKGQVFYSLNIDTDTYFNAEKCWVYHPNENETYLKFKPYWNAPYGTPESMGFKKI
jgi:hypothetical protein